MGFALNVSSCEFKSLYSGLNCFICGGKQPDQLRSHVALRVSPVGDFVDLFNRKVGNTANTFQDFGAYKTYVKIGVCLEHEPNLVCLSNRINTLLAMPSCKESGGVMIADFPQMVARCSASLNDRYKLWNDSITANKSPDTFLAKEFATVQCEQGEPNKEIPQIVMSRFKEEFNNLINLTDYFTPEWEKDFSKMKKHSPDWKKIVKKWDAWNKDRKCEKFQLFLSPKL